MAINPTVQPLTSQMAAWTETMRPSLLYRLARHFGQNPEFISFAGGAPDPDLCPTEALVEAASSVMRHNPRALQYGRDLPELKDQIVGLMAQRGVTCTPEQISITAGGQHAMDLLTRLFLNPSGQVMLEELVYTGVQQVMMPFQPQILTIPIDARQGLDLDRVEAYLEAGARPAFIYTIPSAHNPLAVSLNRAQRERLVALARRYQVPIIEDDAYGFLHYDDDQPEALCSLDSDRVIYMGTFSKILAPGLRLGWIVTPAALTDAVLIMKQISLLSVAPLSQHIVTTYLANNDFEAHLARLRRAYRERRDVMLTAMADHFPQQVTWNRPDGGLFVWAQLPPSFDAEEVVYRTAEMARVGYIPGKAFVTDPAGADGRYDHCLRLTFARYEPALLQTGVARLGAAFQEILEEVAQ